MPDLDGGRYLRNSLRIVAVVFVASTAGYLLWEALSSLNLNAECLTPWGKIAFENPPLKELR